MSDVAVTATVTGFDEAERRVGALNDKLQELAATQKDKLAAAGQQAVETAKDLVQGFGDLAGAAVRVGAVVGVGFTAAISAAVFLLKDTVRESISLGDALTDVSMTSGMAQSKLSDVKVAAEIAGTAFGSVAHGITTFNDRMLKASQGIGEGSRALIAMGISSREVNGDFKDMDALFAEVVEKLATYQDGATKSALASALFAGSAEAVMKTFANGSKDIEAAGIIAQRTGRHMTDEGAKGAADFAREMRILQQDSGSLARELAGPVVRSLGEVAAQMKFAREDGEGFWGTMLRGLQTFTRMTLFPTTASELEKVNKEIEQTTRILVEVEDRIRRGALNQGQVEAAAARLARLYGEQARLQELLSFDKPMSAGGRAAAPELDQQQRRTGSQRDELMDEQRLFIDWMQARVKLRELDLEDVDAWIANQLELATQGSKRETFLLTELGKTREEIRRRDETSLREQHRTAELDERATQKLQADTDKLSMEFARRQIDDLKRQGLEVDALKAAYEALAQELEAYGESGARAAQVVREENRKTRTQAEEDAEAIRRIWGRTSFDTVNVVRGFHGAVQGFFADLMRSQNSLAESFKRLWHGIVDSIISELARLAANWVFRELFGIGDAPGEGGGIGGAQGGGGGGMGGSLFGGALGRFFGGAGGAAGADAGWGGTAATTTPYVAAESGMATPVALGAAAEGGGAAAAAAEGGGAAAVAAESGGALTAGELAGGASLGGAGLFGLTVGAIALDWRTSANAGRRRREAATNQILGVGGQAFLDRINLGDGRYMERAGTFRDPEQRSDPVAEAAEAAFRQSHSVPSDLFLRQGWSMEEVLEYMDANGLQTGGDRLVTRPTMFVAGEVGPERVSVSPMAGVDGNRGGASIVNNGIMILDEYSMRRFKRMLAGV